MRAGCQPLRTRLGCTDGWNPYPGSIRRAFREKVKRTVGRGRACLEVWPQWCIATVIKRTEKQRGVEITRQMARGTLEQALSLLAASHGGTVLTTAFIERLNGTMRERLASLTRTCRHAARRLTALESGMWLLGCTYHFCWPHHELSRRAAHAQGVKGEGLLTPAMESRPDRSCLEHAGIAQLPDGSCSLGGPPSAGTTSHAAVARSGQASTFSRSSAQGGLMLNHQLAESYPSSKSRLF